MAEFLHQVVKKREREAEMRGLVDFDSIARQVAERMGNSSQRPFAVPTRPIPPASQITYASNTRNGVTQHSVSFPNVGSWIQSGVVIVTPMSVALHSPQLLSIAAWEMLAGHPCRPNYTWNNNTYTCNTCSGTYTTDGWEWQHG
jgi:hypothetical protein